MKAVVFLAVLALAGVVKAQDVVTLTIEFDNRGSKVMDKKTNDKIVNALAESIFLVKPSQVSMAGGLGQSSLFNHKSTVMYVASGPTLNNKSLLANCQAGAKSGWFRGSTLEKSLKKATDTWAIGDSVKVKSAACSVPKSGRSGRKMAM